MPKQQRGKTSGQSRRQSDGQLCKQFGEQSRKHSGGQKRKQPVSRSNANVAGNFIEGRRAAAEALRTGFPVKRALIAQGLERDKEMNKLAGDLIKHGIALEYCPRPELDVRSVHGAHQGILLETAPYPYVELADIIPAAKAESALILVLDHITDAGNFGAIVRTAEIVGASGVVIANKRAAEVTVTTYKTSAGAVMHLPIAQVPNVARALDDLKAAGFWVCGATEHATDICWDAPLKGRIALVMGSEGNGISRLILDKCDFTTKLPQLGKTESLNVAQAATALCFEWLRQNADALGCATSSSPDTVSAACSTGTEA